MTLLSVVACLSLAKDQPLQPIIQRHLKSTIQKWVQIGMSRIKLNEILKDYYCLSPAKDTEATYQLQNSIISEVYENL